jgi:hypothetical protein
MLFDELHHHLPRGSSSGIANKAATFSLNLDERLRALRADRRLGELSLEVVDFALRRGRRRRGLRAALLGPERLQLAALSDRTPLDEVGAVEPLPAQESADLARLGARVGLDKNPALEFGAERPASGLGPNLRGRNRRAPFIGHRHYRLVRRPAQ